MEYSCAEVRYLSLVNVVTIFTTKKTLQVINSGINPKVYAFFKRDIKHECGRLLFKKRRYLTAE